jgi:hypothetical protein
MTRPSVNGWTQYSTYSECATGIHNKSSFCMFVEASLLGFELKVKAWRWCKQYPLGHLTSMQII